METQAFTSFCGFNFVNCVCRETRLLWVFTERGARYAKIKQSFPPSIPRWENMLSPHSGGTAAALVQNHLAGTPA